ncbi:MAG: NAD-dependent epimerase/dehydratase family protein [Verrucomicrobiota bacterium]
MDHNRDTVIVMGARGWVGRQVCDWLHRNGQRVVGFGRNAAAGPWTHFVVGDLSARRGLPVELHRELGRAIAVVHCAGRAHQPRENTDDRSVFHEVNVAGTMRVIDACRAAGVSRLVYTSTIAGYDWSQICGKAAGEDAPQRPATIYAQSKLDGEGLVSGSGLDWRVARLATVFGSGDPANFATLARALKRGRFVLPGEGDARKSVLPVRFAAEVLGHLALTEIMPERCFNVALPEAPSLAEICHTFCLECNFRPPRALPQGILRMGARFGDAIAKAGIGFPLTTTSLGKLVGSTVVDARRLYRALAHLQPPSLSEAVRESAEFYRGL